MTHVVTQEDLDTNPELVSQGVKVGDTIQLPDTDSEITPAIFSFGQLAGLLIAELGGNVAHDADAFEAGLKSVSTAEKPTIEQWSDAVFSAATNVVASLPKSDTTEKILQLLTDGKQAVLDGEQGKGGALFIDAIKLFKDFKAFKK